MNVPFVSAEQMTTLVPSADAIEAIEHAVRTVDPASDPARTVLDVPHGQLLLMPSVSAGLGVKLATVAADSADNRSSGLPRVQAVYVLFDEETLAPQAVLDGAALTTLRTPAVSVAAVKPALVARDDPPRVVVFGAGPQGVGHVEALSSVFELADVTYVVRHPDGRDRTLAAGTDEADAVLRAADVVVCATTARNPLFDSTVLSNDVVVIAVGSHEPDARELDSALMSRAQVVVEDIATARRECGDIVQAIADESLLPESLVPLRDYVTGRVEPATDRPVVFKGSGMAWQDLAVARRVHARLG